MMDLVSAGSKFTSPSTFNPQGPSSGMSRQMWTRNTWLARSAQPVWLDSCYWMQIKTQFIIESLIKCLPSSVRRVCWIGQWYSWEVFLATPPSLGNVHMSNWPKFSLTHRKRERCVGEETPSSLLCLIQALALKSDPPAKESTAFMELVSETLINSLNQHSVTLWMLLASSRIAAWLAQISSSSG